MKLFRVFSASALFVLVYGCVSMNTPSASLIDTMPVITIGEDSEAPENHIVFIPANRKFPIEFSVIGNVFTENATSTVMVSFKQDMYLYKYWASLDGNTWIDGLVKSPKYIYA